MKPMAFFIPRLYVAEPGLSLQMHCKCKSVTSSFSQEQFILFHTIDRDVYRILVTGLSRDPVESIQVLGMWLWLERVGFRNLVKKIHSLPYTLINEVADETVTCLNCISNTLTIPPSPLDGNVNDITLLQSLVEKEISLQFLYENRVAAICGVATVVQDVCLRAVSDIMQQAIMRNAAERMAAAQNSEQKFWFCSIGSSTLRLAGNVGGGSAEMAAAAAVEAVVPADDRTLFVTFSKGYRVEEWEVMEFFTKTHGDCIEALFMQEVQGDEQPLFARIVFKKVCTIDMILRGATKVKFNINGKHVWVRKFVPKRTKSLISGESSSGGSGL